ncbi:hypothetical protein OH77DRAFT_1413006, partial [Trametes cingulata]
MALFEQATEHLFPRRTFIQPFILAALLVTSALHTLSGVSRPAANLILTTFRVVLVGAFLSCSKEDSAPSKGFSPVSRSQQDLLHSIPQDVRTALSRLNIQPNFIRYASC